MEVKTLAKLNVKLSLNSARHHDNIQGSDGIAIRLFNVNIDGG
jgi:hypothetical protein